DGCLTRVHADGSNLDQQIGFTGRRLCDLGQLQGKGVERGGFPVCESVHRHQRRGRRASESRPSSSNIASADFSITSLGTSSPSSSRNWLAIGSASPSGI